MKLNPIQKAVLSTLTFFDIFDRPLTFEEIQLYLYGTAADETILEKELRNLIAKNKIAKLGDWYFLPGRLKFLQEYPAREKHSKDLLAQAKKNLNNLRIIPFLEMLAITNSVALGTVHAKSDIDIFSITRKNRLYTARFFLVLYLKTKGIYPKDAEDKAGKICASFYIDDTQINLEKIHLEKIQDIYFNFWLASLNPIYGRTTYEKFIQSNSWWKELLPNFDFKLKYTVSGWNFLPSETKNLWAKFWEFFLGGFLGDLIEKMLRDRQIQHLQSLPQNFSAEANTILQKNLLKIHIQDKRKEFAQIFQEKMQGIET